MYNVIIPMKVINFFDKFEDRIREGLSHKPITYAIIGGIGIVLFWRGVWHLADDYSLSSWASLIISVIILLATGLFVSFFIGEQVIISGLRHEGKLTEKTEGEIETEEDTLKKINLKLNKISKDIEELKKKK